MDKEGLLREESSNIAKERYVGWMHKAGRLLLLTFLDVLPHAGIHHFKEGENGYQQ